MLSKQLTFALQYITKCDPISSRRISLTGSNFILEVELAVGRFERKLP